MADWFAQNAPSGQAQGDWFSSNAPKAASQPQDAGFWNTLRSDIASGVKKIANIPHEVAAGNTVKDLTEMGTAITEGRKQAWQQMKDAYARGDYKEAFEHLVGAFPVLGPPINQAANELRAPAPGQSPDTTHLNVPGQGAAHAVEALAPMVLPEAIEAAPTIAKAAAGGARGGFEAATSTMPLRLRGIQLNVPTVVASGAAGGTAARAMGLPHELGAAVGAAAPIVKGIYQGAREALAPAAEVPEPPPGFGVASGSTVGPIPETQPFTPGYQPPVTGALPTQAPPAPVFDPNAPLSSGTTMAAPRASAPPVRAAYQPPITGALPNLSEPVPEPSAPVPQNVAPLPVGPAEAEAARVAQLDKAAEDSGLLDALSQDQAGMPFKKLDMGRQQIVIRLARQIAENGDVAPTSAPSAPVPQSEPAAIAVGPSGEFAAGAPVKLSPAEVAQQLRDEMVRSGTIPEAQPEQPAVTSESLAPVMRDLPPAMRQAAADANYRAVKEGAAEPETAAPTYQAAARATKTENVARALLDAGVGYDRLSQLTRPELESTIQAVAQELGEKKLSDVSLDELMERMRAAKPKQPEPMPEPKAATGNGASFISAPAKSVKAIARKLTAMGDSNFRRASFPENLGQDVASLVSSGEWDLGPIGDQASFERLTKAMGKRMDDISNPDLRSAQYQAFKASLEKNLKPKQPEAAPESVAAPTPEPQRALTPEEELAKYAEPEPAEVDELKPPVVPDPPRPLAKTYGPRWADRPDAEALKAQFSKKVYERQKALKAYKAYVEESNRRFAASRQAQ